MDNRSTIASVLGVVAAVSLWFAMTQLAPPYVGEFAIILSKDNTKIVTGPDILYYNPDSHEFTLTDECAERLKPMGWRLSGEFKIIIDGESVLGGVAVPPTVSRSYDIHQVVLLYPTFDKSSMNYSEMKLQLGYPWDQSALLDSVNPLDNAKIVGFFERSGRLVR